MFVRQVLEAKTNASSLTAKLTDTEAELRAATGRVEDVSAKVCQGCLVMLRLTFLL